jgi:hypothetical protein
LILCETWCLGALVAFSSFALSLARYLSVVLLQVRMEKVSPPFQGGVAGIPDYLMFTKFISRPGWLI